MRSRTYRAVTPIDPAVTTNTVSNIGRALLIVILLIVAIVAMRWLGEQRIKDRVAVQPTPVVESAQPTVVPSTLSKPPAPTPIPYTAQVNAQSLSEVSTYQIEHQRCENLGYTDVVFEERPYGWLVTCKE